MTAVTYRAVGCVDTDDEPAAQQDRYFPHDYSTVPSGGLTCYGKLPMRDWLIIILMLVAVSLYLVTHPEDAERHMAWLQGLCIKGRLSGFC